jgi:hypothetical protein
MHWLEPYEIAYVTEGGVAQLKTLKGEWKEGLVNGSWLKLYYENQLPHNSKYKHKEKGLGTKCS